MSERTGLCPYRSDMDHDPAPVPRWMRHPLLLGCLGATVLSLVTLIAGVLMQTWDVAAGQAIRSDAALIALWVAVPLFGAWLVWTGLMAGLRFARLARDSR